jgi:hypothetical protein
MLNVKKHLAICSENVTFVVGKPGRRDSASSVLFTNGHKKSGDYKPPHDVSILPNQRTLKR